MITHHLSALVVRLCSASSHPPSSAQTGLPQPRCLVLAGLFLFAMSALSGVAQPFVAAVTSSQVAGTRTVAISYTLAHPQSLPCTVTMQASRDTGATWETVTSTTGDVGAGKTSTSTGVAKSITWNADAAWPAQLFPQVKIRIAADDGQSGGGPAPNGMVVIPAGTFTMGDSKNEGESNELPTHAVTLSAFYLQSTEVTYGQWKDIADWNRVFRRGYDFAAGQRGAGGTSPFGALADTAVNDTHPVSAVSWYDVIKWCNAKSENEGLVPVYYTNDAQTTVYRTGSVDVSAAQVKWAANGYRLPTEAEWEYAARGGQAGKRYPWGDALALNQANYYSGSGTYRGTTPVGYYNGSQTPTGVDMKNGYGLYDMAGNVCEWNWDWAGDYSSMAQVDPRGPPSGAHRMARGGAWGLRFNFLRSAFRSLVAPTGFRSSSVGFRPARALRDATHTADSAAFSFDLRATAPVTLSSASGSFSGAAGVGSVSVFTTGSWAITVSDSWIVASGGNSGTGNGTISYSVTANTASTARSGTITVGDKVYTITQGPAAGRIINLSVLTDIASAGDNFTLGYVVGGSGTGGPKPLVIRAAGPSLGVFGIADILADPKLETFAGATKTGENDNWGGSGSLTAALAAVGAFAYTGPTSRDAAALASITTRDNSVVVSGVGGGTGKVIAEVYDATSADSFTGTTPRLINVSVRKHLGSGLTVGFVLGGAAPTKVVIRAVGPTLGGFGVAGVVADPQLTLFNDKSAQIGQNNDWGGTAELTAAFAAVGAFGLPAASKDAALVVTLQPGNYTVVATGTSNTTGVAIVEVYEMP